jgi:hypothetical protein
VFILTLLNSEHDSELVSPVISFHRVCVSHSPILFSVSQVDIFPEVSFQKMCVRFSDSTNQLSPSYLFVTNLGKGSITLRTFTTSQPVASPKLLLMIFSSHLILL